MYSYMDDPAKGEDEDELEDLEEKERTDESKKNEEKSYNWSFMHVSAVVDGQQYIIHHDPDLTGACLVHVVVCMCMQRAESREI